MRPKNAPPGTITIAQALEKHLESVRHARSPNTARTYAYALRAFTAVLEDHECPPDNTPCADLPEEAVRWLIEAINARDLAPTTERLYLTAATGFYKFLAAEGLLAPNLSRIDLFIRQRARRPGYRLPQFPRDEIEAVLSYASTLASAPAKNEAERLRNLRDHAFLLSLADTGLRVHEACGLRRGDLAWHEHRAIITGKGNREDVVRFTSRAIRAIQQYIKARAKMDGNTGRQLTSLPIFARHDRGAGNKTKPITTATGRNIVKQRVREALGAGAVTAITPHTFRHYFVTTALIGSGGNIKVAQELARHQNVQTTSRYAHLADTALDKDYYEIFEENN
jgi:site-specific recombinase XerD